MKLNVTQKLSMTLALWMLASTAAWADYEGYTKDYITGNGLVFKRLFTDEDPTGSTCIVVRPSKNNKNVWAKCNDYGQSIGYADPMGNDPEVHVGPDGDEYTGTNYVIPSVIGGAKVVAIDGQAFKGNTHLTSITFPAANLTSIPGNGFEECTALKSLNFNGSSIKSIGTAAFAKCTALESIEDWGNVETIHGSTVGFGYGSFGGCTALTELKFGPSVKYIYGNAFGGCTGVTRLIFEDGDDWLELSPGGGNEGGATLMFYDSPITYVYIGRKMTNNIQDGYMVFSNPLCYIKEDVRKTISEMTVDFGPNIDIIRYAIFYRMDVPLVVSAPAATDIEQFAFRDANVKSIDVPKIKRIDDYAFSGSQITGMNFYSVEEIGMGAFYTSHLESATLPKTLKSIGENAFVSNDKYSADEGYLKKLVIEDGDNPIELGYNHSEYETLKDNTSFDWTIHVYSLNWLDSNVLEELYIGRPVGHEPDINQTVSDTKFADALKFDAKKFPKLKKAELTKVRHISAGAFFASLSPDDPKSSLEEVSLPMLKSVPDDCFYNCTKLTKVDIPKAEVLGYKAFACTSGDLDISFINTVDSIKEKCFEESGISGELTIPGTLKYIGLSVFNNCKNLKKVTFEYGEKPLAMDYFLVSNFRGVMSIGGNKCGIEEFYFDRNVEPCTYEDDLPAYTKRFEIAISDGSFESRGYPQLKSVTIGKNLTSLEGYTFQAPGLEFIRCENPQPIALEYTTYEDDETFNVDHSVGDSFSNSVQEQVKLLVPEGSVSDYLAADVWKGFRNLTDNQGNLGTIAITIPKEGSITYSGLHNLDFSKLAELKAYIVSSYDGDSETIELSPVTDVSAIQGWETGVLIKGTPGTYQVPVVPVATKSTYLNMLTSITSNQLQLQEKWYTYYNYSSTAVDVYNCYLKDGVFMKSSGSVTVGPNAAYLQIPTFLKDKKGDDVTVTLGNSAFTPLCSDVDLNFTNVQGLEAYCATGFTNSGTITLTRVNRVPANTVVMLKGTSGAAYTIPSEKIKAICMNMLLMNPYENDITIEESQGLVYLYLDGDKFKVAKAGTTIAPGAVYLNALRYAVDENGPEEYSIVLKESETMSANASCAPITIGKSGKASYCGDQSLDFSGSEEIKAYIATGFDKDAEIIWLTRVKDVPAGTPVLIKGEANKTYDVPVTDSQNSYYTNMFVGNTSGEKMVIQETDGDMVNYYLSGDGTFKSVNKTANIGNNKCYLQLPGTFNATVTGATQTVKVGSIGKASFAAPVDLDFTNVSGLKAFTATGYDKSTKTIWLTRVMKVQKGEGVLLKGDAKDYEIPSAAVQSSYMNMFAGNTSGDKIQVQETSEDGSQTNFYLNGDGAFVSVKGYVNIKNNKCYLALPTSMVAVSSTRSAEDDYKFEEPEVIKLPIDFKSIGSEGDGTTSIREVKSGEAKSDEWYTLQGQRVAKPGKGLYIRNGKKVIVR